MKYLKRFSLEIMIVLVSAFVVFISSCKDDFHRSEYEQSKQHYSEVGGKYGERVFTDPETGCQYFSRADFLTPRLGTDGFPLCGNSIPVEG